jgi:hypothetical protein
LALGVFSDQFQVGAVAGPQTGACRDSQSNKF